MGSQMGVVSGIQVVPMWAKLKTNKDMHKLQLNDEKLTLKQHIQRAGNKKQNIDFHNVWVRHIYGVQLGPTLAKLSNFIYN